MFILAEIVDKTPMAFELWLISGAIGLLFGGIGLIHRYVGFCVFAAGVLFSIAWMYSSYYEAFEEPHFSECIREEMGMVWIAHSLVSGICPIVFTSVVLFWHFKKRRFQQVQ